MEVIMIKTNKIKTVVVAGMLSLALTVPVLTPVANAVPGGPVITTQAEAKSITLSAAKKKLKKKLKSAGKWKNGYRIDHIATEQGYYVFYIVYCTSSGCNPVGYADVKKKTGKVYYTFKG